MVQRRLINGSLGSSKKYYRLNHVAGKLADFCHALFPLLAVKADSYGRMVADAFGIKQSIFPVSLHSEDDFEKALQALHKAELILLYSGAGRRYLYVIHFRREQPGIKYIAKSSCPAPPPEFVKNLELTGFDLISPDLPSDEKRSRSEVEDILENKSSLGSADAPRRARRPKPTGLTAPPDDLPITDALKDWASKHVPTVSSVGRLTEETALMLDHFRARGERRADWEATRRNWLKTAVRFEHSRGGVNAGNGRPQQASGSGGTGPSRHVPVGPEYVPRKRG